MADNNDDPFQMYLRGAPPDESPEQRNKRIAARVNMEIRNIRQSYESSLQTPEERNQAMDAAEASLIADQEERYRQGKVTLEQLNFLKRSMDGVEKLMKQMKEKEEKAPAREPPKKPVWTFNHSQYGNITINDDGCRQWRQATTDDVGSSIVLVNDPWQGDHKREFGELDDLEEEPDEEFPDETHKVAIVYTQSGEEYRSAYAVGGKWEDVLIVPEEILQGVRDEAPPGKRFSGKSVNGHQHWSPAPEGKVWFDHPFLNHGPQYFSDEQYFFVKRRIDFGALSRSDEFEFRIFEEAFHFAYWCPVLKKFLNEGEMYRQQHWFHNGDGSAQQRYYYSQNEMFQRHGGLSTLPTAVVVRDNRLFLTWDESNQAPEISRVRTADQIIEEKFKEAERNGQVVRLDLD